MRELKIDEIHKLIDLISKNHKDFGQVLNDNIGNSQFIIDYLDSFIKTYQNHDYERALIDYLDTAVLGSKSMINLLIEKLQHNQQENSSKMRASTNKLLHEFYISMMLAVGKGQSFLELCYKVKDFFKGGNLKLNKDRSEL